ncbi:MAG TPA: hypothetical protein VJU79_01805 [Candidatus Dormibacteraeota bacterium]|nr:hypothetical protein [Candidatus Dormibacteraeota bacterium]
MAQHDCAGTLTSLHSGCAVSPHSAGDDCAALGDFKIDEDRTTASLDASVPLYDRLSNSDPAPQVSTLDINTDWTGVGKLRSEMIHYQLGKMPVGDSEAIVINLDHESCRDASLTGAISEDGGATNYLDGATTESHLCEQIPGSLFLYVFPFK